MHHNNVTNQEVVLLNGSVTSVGSLKKGCGWRFYFGGVKGVHLERGLTIFACFVCLVLVGSIVLTNLWPGRHCKILCLCRNDQGLHPTTSCGGM